MSIESGEINLTRTGEQSGCSSALMREVLMNMAGSSSVQNRGTGDSGDEAARDAAKNPAAQVPNDALQVANPAVGAAITAALAEAFPAVLSEQQAQNNDATSPIGQLQQVLNSRGVGGILTQAERGALAMLMSNIGLRTPQQREAFVQSLPAGYNAEFTTLPTNPPQHTVTFRYRGQNIGGVVQVGNGPFLPVEDQR